MFVKARLVNRAARDIIPRRGARASTVTAGMATKLLDLQEDAIVSIMLRVPRAATLKAAFTSCRQLRSLIATDDFKALWVDARQCFPAQDASTIVRILANSTPLTPRERDSVAELIGELRFETIAAPDGSVSERLPPLARAQPPAFFYETQDVDASEGDYRYCSPGTKLMKRKWCAMARVSVRDSFMLASWTCTAYDANFDGAEMETVAQLHVFRNEQPFQSYCQDVCSVLETEYGHGCNYIADDLTDEGSMRVVGVSGMGRLRQVLGTHSSSSQVPDAILLTVLLCAASAWLELGYSPDQTDELFPWDESMQARMPKLSAELAKLERSGGDEVVRSRLSFYQSPALRVLQHVSPGCYLLEWDPMDMSHDERHEMRRRITNGKMHWLENDWPELELEYASTEGYASTEEEDEASS